jgi:hypothetical protein
MAEYPARTWEEHGRPPAGRWMGWMNADQPYLFGRRVQLSAYGQLVMAEFPDGDRVKFQAGTPFRLAPLAVQQ